MILSSKIPLSIIVVVIAITHSRLKSIGLDESDILHFYFCASLSIFGFIFSLKLIPKVKDIFIERGNLWGYDINKGGKEHGVKVYVLFTKLNTSIN